MTPGSDLIITVGMRSKSNLPGGMSFTADATSENKSLQLRFGSFSLRIVPFSPLKFNIKADNGRLKVRRVAHVQFCGISLWNEISLFPTASL